MVPLRPGGARLEPRRREPVVAPPQEAQGAMVAEAAKVARAVPEAATPEAAQSEGPRQILRPSRCSLRWARGLPAPDVVRTETPMPQSLQEDGGRIWDVRCSRRRFWQPMLAPRFPRRARTAVEGRTLATRKAPAPGAVRATRPSRRAPMDGFSTWTPTAPRRPAGPCSAKHGETSVATSPATTAIPVLIPAFRDAWRSSCSRVQTSDSRGTSASVASAPSSK